MKDDRDTICLRNVRFKKITEKTFNTLNISDIKYFFISASGAIDTPGNIYIFTSDKAFFINKNEYSNNFLSILDERPWRKINLYFCDFLFIAPEIYNSFIKKLCARNIRDFWFETTIDIFKDQSLK